MESEKPTVAVLGMGVMGRAMARATDRGLGDEDVTVVVRELMNSMHT
jgi:hypothetical protein